MVDLRNIQNLKGLTLLQIETCAKCGICAEKCPSYSSTKKDLSLIPGVKMDLTLKTIKLAGKRGSKAEYLLENLVDALYSCTLCGACLSSCPFELQDERVWRKLRQLIYSDGLAPESIKKVVSSIKEFGNPYMMDRDLRIDWIDYTGLEDVPVGEKADVVYFTGCTVSFKPSAQIIAYHTVNLLSKLSVNYTILGEDEECCGSPLLMAGERELAREIALKNIKAIENLNAKTVLTTCPSCYRTLKYEYRVLTGLKPKFNVAHITQYMAKVLRKGTLKVKNGFNETVTYHDPCELSRLGGIVEEPREILRKLNIKLIEPEESRFKTRCCGGGGLLQVYNDSHRIEIADYRLRQLLNTGADKIVSACPACKITLESAVKRSGKKVKVLDIVEILDQLLDA